MREIKIKTRTKNLKVVERKLAAISKIRNKHQKRTNLMKERFKIIVSVYVLFVKDGKLLMLRRANTGYEDGKYSLVAGHIDGNEALTEATAREAKEESGVEIKPTELRLKVVMHRIDDREQLDFFFECRRWKGNIKNMEPQKCDDLDWFPLDKLPGNTIPYIREAIHCYRDGVAHSEFGWEKEI